MSPFRSQSQRRMMYSQHPQIAARWEAETPKGEKLPEHAKRIRDKVRRKRGRKSRR